MSFEPGGRRWLWQWLTTAFLVVALVFHFFLLHFVNHADEVTLALSQARMEQLIYFLPVILFLVTATFHGVNNVYNVLVNQGLSGARKTVVKAILGLASVLLIVQGVRTVLERVGGVSI